MPPERPLQGLDPEGSDGKTPRSKRDWVVDLGVFLLAIVAGAFGFLWPFSQDASAPESLQIADLVFGLLACLAVFFRRRWPLGLALALLTVGLFSGASQGHLVAPRQLGDAGPAALSRPSLCRPR